MKTYTISRHGYNGSYVQVVVKVVPTDYQSGDFHQSYALPHLVHHSPDGFEYGYGGSGPSDLARSMVGDLLGTKNPKPADYHAVKFALIARLEGDGPHEITEAQIREVLDA